MKVILILLAITIIVLILAYIFPLATVIGNSMLPTYHEGNLLLCRRVFNKKSHDYCEGRVYVFKAPYDDEEQRLIIKRVSFVIKERNNRVHIYLTGDNPAESLDSRTYGTVSCDNAVAKVLFKIK